MQEFAKTQKHMGVNVSLSVIIDSEKQAEKILDDTFTTINSYENRFSRFIPESELSQLNKCGEMDVSEEFFIVMQRSRELYQKTAGAFNPLFQISRYGYDRNFSDLPKVATTANDLNDYNIDFNSMIMDKETRRIKLQPGQQIDLGGVLKGYLAEKLSCNISEQNPHCIGNIVNIGGDIHTCGFEADGSPFKFFILNPVTNNQIHVTLTDTSLATSGTYKRTWETKFGTRHHILGEQAVNKDTAGICSASIIHKDGAAADAYAKLFLLKGTVEAPRIIDNTNIKYLLIHNDGEIETNIL